MRVFRLSAPAGLVNLKLVEEEPRKPRAGKCSSGFGPAR